MKVMRRIYSTDSFKEISFLPEPDRILLRRIEDAMNVLLHGLTSESSPRKVKRDLKELEGLINLARKRRGARMVNKTHCGSCGRSLYRTSGGNVLPPGPYFCSQVCIDSFPRRADRIAAKIKWWVVSATCFVLRRPLPDEGKENQ